MIFKYYIPQNTGWTDGISWFNTYPDAELRCETLEEAQAYNTRHKNYLRDPSVRFRVKYVEIKETYYE